MNWKRIVLGGLVAGLIINMSQGALHEGVLKDTWSTAMQALGKTGEFSGGQIAMFNIMGFMTGIALVCLYASIRPRYGAGPKTALCAASTVWLLTYMLPTIGQIAMDLWPLGALITTVLWGLVEMIVAGLAGSWLYREQDQAT
ncbi:MAG: hypothetical protein OXB98_16945 [Bryobacterales bacterium]|nr:hypothetical protein [Bryobacterales bacterium]